MNQGEETEKPKPGLGNPQDIRVLMYRRIVCDEDAGHADTSAVRVSQFQSHMELLERWGFTSITLEDYRLFLEGVLNLPRKPVVIGFDGDYLELYELAFPVLQDLGMKAVIFVGVSPNRKGSAWDALDGGDVSPLLNERQIIEMHSAGFEIGSRALTGGDLTAMPAEAAWEEISRSRMLLEILLNAPVKTFAYPDGALNAETKRMVADAGYTVAWSLHSGLATLTLDPFEVRPIVLDSRVTGLGLALRLSSPYRLFQSAQWRWQEFFGSTNGRRVNDRRESEKSQ
ncbi:MAG: polysaccharide deacetylase family protein [Bacteroidota bacterium]